MSPSPPTPFDSLQAPNPAIDLTTLDLVHQYAGVQSDSQDTLIQLCITAASYEWIWRTGRGNEGEIDANSPFVAPVQYTESYDGNGSWQMLLRNWPVVSVQSLIINGVSLGASTGFGFPGYLIHRNKKSLVIQTGWRQSRLGRAGNGGFIEGLQNIQVVYTAGYSFIPPQIVRACSHMVAVNYKRTAWLDLGSESMSAQGGASGTTSYRSWIVPPEVQRVMDDFTRNWGI